MVNKKKTIGFIGCGSMGRAILRGLLDTGYVEPLYVLVSTSKESTEKEIEESFGVRTSRDNRHVAEKADILFLAVKPYLYEEIISEIKDHVPEDTLIVGMAAGITLKKMERWFGAKRKTVKIMPNTPVAVKAGVIALAPSDALNGEEREEIIRLLEKTGQVTVIKEDHMDVITGIAGSSPAYVYMFIEAMADVAVKNGLPRKDAYEIAAQAVMGAAKMVVETGIHPGVLKDMVTSPGGTTIEAVAKLEEKGLRHAVISAVDACIEKSKEMTK